MRNGTVMLISARLSNGREQQSEVQQRQSNPLWSNTDNAEVVHGHVGRRHGSEKHWRSRVAL